MSAPPSIPPRPTRVQNSVPSPAPAATLDTPKIPPRPKRGVDRSVSPHRDTYARSPLNDPTFLHNGPPPKESSRLATEVPSRPPSVSLPSLGEEGNEYASFEDLTKPLTNDSLDKTISIDVPGQSSPQQTKIVAGDLPLHAPKASVPSSTAKTRIQTVTRTDSSQAEAAGIGRLAPDDKFPQSSKNGQSGSSRSSRPSSLYNEKDEHGIPEIGVQVPMFRNAGDVQAPTPSPFEQQTSSGIGFHNKSGGRHHGRTKSGREIFHGPPGSYGMHGHGKISTDEFEQKWYEKHPEDLKREKAGEYGPHIQENRKDYHWRADNLDKLVHAAGHNGIGFGTSREAVGTPDEQIGYIASEEYASRMASPRPQSTAHPALMKSGHVDSMLRKEVSPAGGAVLDDQGNVIHIDPPAHRGSKIHGGGYDPPTEDLGPKGGNTATEGGWVTERGYGTPILASDELKKHPEAEWRQPAISPELERRGDDYTVNEDGTPAYITKVRSHSRPSSRNSNAPPPRFISSPGQHDRGNSALESHKEYEPLFPEDEDQPGKLESEVDKFKRPNLARHHFPSQDVWEDTPGSLQLETTVETPQAPEEAEVTASVSPSKVFEDLQNEERRKTTITKADQESFLPEHTKQFAAENKHLQKARDEAPLRPGLGQRFPSQDIWEDAPDHGRLETTVSAPQTEESNEYADEVVSSENPSVPARPTVPARPQKKEASPIDKKTPAIPERPKPQVTTRLAKPQTTTPDSSESRDVGSEAVQSKSKPPVPARPGGSKIAALQAGFLKDLNSKLGLGPQAPKVKEPESAAEETPAPLQDARKGRAKGPQRRKPAASPVPAVTVTAEVAVPHPVLDFGPVTAVWSIDTVGDLSVPAAKAASILAEALGPSSGTAEFVQPATQAVDVDEVRSSEVEFAGDSVTSNTALAAPAGPVLRKTVSGSVDAPGAFPDSTATASSHEESTRVTSEDQPSKGQSSKLTIEEST